MGSSVPLKLEDGGSRFSSAATLVPFAPLDKVDNARGSVAFCPVDPVYLYISLAEDAVCAFSNIPFLRVVDAVAEGLNTACIAGAVTAVPTLVGCRVLPWAKANLNYTAQALIISEAAVSGFFISADKTILKGAKKNSLDKLK